MTSVEYDGRMLRIGDVERELPGDIEAVRTIDELIVVRFTPIDPADEPRNVRAFGSDGTVRWTIEPTIGPLGDENPYVLLSERDGELWVTDWKGMEYGIDLEKGTHTVRKLRK
ncbi:hypothetical protein [Natrarchaeobaculum sulfurireducens]|nr:hypothetical protein [Natrarchaeobaculum sulfurireducens]